MLTGALVGALVGTIMVVVTLARKTGFQKKFFAALAGAGPAEARRLLDQHYPPRTKIPMSKILDHRERMAALAVLGDVAALDAEIAGHDGALTCVTQINAMAHIAIALRSPERRASEAQRLDALATRMEREGGALMSLVKKKTRALATLARGIAGEPLKVEEQAAVLEFTREPAFTGLVMKQALATALRQTGVAGKADELEAQVRLATRAFG